MALFDACVVGISLRSFDISRHARPEDIGQSELFSAHALVVVARRLEGPDQSAALARVAAQLLALPIAQHRDVGQNHGRIFLQRLRVEVVLMHEIEQEAAFQQGVVHALQKVARRSAAGRCVERIHALAKDHRHARQRLLVDEVRLVLRDPLKEIAPRRAPALVLRCAAQPVIPRHHAARRGLRHPHRGLGRRLRGVPPQRLRVRVAPGHVGDRAALHHRLRHAPLLRAIPDRRVAGSALMVGIEPAGHRGYAPHIGGCADAAAQVAHVDAVGLLFFRRVVPELPHLEHARHVLVTECRSAALRQPLAGLAATGRRKACARPAVRKESIDVVERVDFADDRRHLFGEIRAEHARLEERGRFAMLHRLPVGRAHEPLRPRLLGFLICQVAVQPRHHAHTARLGCFGEVAE